MDPKDIEEKITKKTKTILVVNLYVSAVDIAKVTDLAHTFNLRVIEDSAQAYGALYNGKRTGNLGDAAGFSFYLSKNLDSLGDSNAVTISDSGLVVNS